MKRITTLLLVMSLILAGSAFAEKPDPVNQVKGPVEKGIALLKNPEYGGEDKKEEQREKIWELVREVFDFKLISMRTLALNWKKLDDVQRKEFTEAFSELLKNTYIDKIQGEFHDEEVVFSGKEIISEKKAVVNSKIIRQGNIEIPMNYSVFFRDGRWWVYDVNIEGISLVKNYRTQFKNILSKETPDQLIARLKEKNEKHEKDRKADPEKSDS